MFIVLLRSPGNPTGNLSPLLFWEVLRRKVGVVGSKQVVVTPLDSEEYGRKAHTMFPDFLVNGKIPRNLTLLIG